MWLDERRTCAQRGCSREFIPKSSRHRYAWFTGGRSRGIRCMTSDTGGLIASCVPCWRRGCVPVSRSAPVAASRSSRTSPGISVTSTMAGRAPIRAGARSLRSGDESRICERARRNGSTGARRLQSSGPTRKPATMKTASTPSLPMLRSRLDLLGRRGAGEVDEAEDDDRQRRDEMARKRPQLCGQIGHRVRRQRRGINSHDRHIAQHEKHVDARRERPCPKAVRMKVVVPPGPG